MIVAPSGAIDPPRVDFWGRRSQLRSGFNRPPTGTPRFHGGLAFDTTHESAARTHAAAKEDLPVQNRGSAIRRGDGDRPGCAAAGHRLALLYRREPAPGRSSLVERGILAGGQGAAGRRSIKPALPEAGFGFDDTLHVAATSSADEGDRSTLGATESLPV